MKPDEAWKYIGDEFYKRYNHDFLTIEETEGLMKMVGSDENPMRDFQSTIDQAVVENWSIDTFSIAVSDFANSLNVINGEHEQLMIQVELLVSSFYVWQEVEQLNGLGEAGFVIGCDGLGLGLGGPGGAAAASIASCVVLIAYYTWFA
ncbi:hypothetical protein HOD19_01205 [bacterium]|nr:hypothetical protein [bacterium]MBT4649383.1 hypothetical protein [bacterium]